MNLHLTCPEPLQRLAALLPSPLYVVGGYVRNALLWGDTTGTDIDICGPMEVAPLTHALRDTDAQVIPVNPRIGTVLIRLDGAAYEYTTWRQDSYPADGTHTPTAVRFVQDIRVDSMRRDFRVNALYADVITGEVLDPTEGGLADLKKHILRTTRAPEDVFDEDGLRILRLVRFAAELGFAPHEDTLRVATAVRHKLADISPERRREEWERILLADTRYGVADAPSVGCRMLTEMGLWPYLLGHDAMGARWKTYPPQIELRLAGVCLSVAEANGVDAVALAKQALGRAGLRWSNATVGRVSHLLAGSTPPNDMVEWRHWATRYTKDKQALSALWQDPALDAMAEEACRQIETAKVPCTHKDLPLTPAQFAALGVAQADLGKTMQAIVDRSVALLIRPTAEQCIQLMQEIR